MTVSGLPLLKSSSVMAKAVFLKTGQHLEVSPRADLHQTVQGLLQGRTGLVDKQSQDVNLRSLPDAGKLDAGHQFQRKAFCRGPRPDYAGHRVVVRQGNGFQAGGGGGRYNFFRRQRAIGRVGVYMQIYIIHNLSPFLIIFATLEILSQHYSNTCRKISKTISKTGKNIFLFYINMVYYRLKTTISCKIG